MGKGEEEGDMVEDCSLCPQVYRVYYDRLVDVKDHVWLFELLQKMVKQHFKEDFSGVFRHLVKDGGGKVTDDDMRSLMFGDYMKPDVVGTCIAL